MLTYPTYFLRCRHCNYDWVLLHISHQITTQMVTKPWAFESREFLRALCVGKQVNFTSIHSLPAGTDDIPRDLGNAELLASPPIDISLELLRAGWAKTKELKREPTEEDEKRKALEEEARGEGRGMWNPQGPKVRSKFFMDECGPLTNK